MTTETLDIHTGEMSPTDDNAHVIVWDNVHVSGTLSLLVSVGAAESLHHAKVTLNRAQARALRDRLDAFLDESEADAMGRAVREEDDRINARSPRDDSNEPEA